jgi:hypothetical protein
MENKNLILSNIFWKKHPENERYYYLKDNDKIILLRINNFPDEPLYTLINGLNIIDIEDKPVGWSLENR